MNDIELELALESAVTREREVVSEILRYLREVEKRRLYLDSGFSSMFAYCTEKLGYSEPEAQLRIQAMRLIRVAPEALPRLERGTLSLSVAAQIQSATRNLPASRASELVMELTGFSKRSAEKRIAEIFPSQSKPDRTKQIAENAVEIRFTVSRDEAELFEKLLDRNAHTNFERSKAQLFVKLARAALKKFEGKQAQDSLPHGPAKVRSRYIPMQTRRKIWQRDKGFCQYVDPTTGKQCNSRHGLQLDHIERYSEGGSHEPENLRLLCGPHYRNF
jgi:hypothetical protein